MPGSVLTALMLGQEFCGARAGSGFRVGLMALVAAACFRPAL